MDEAVSRARLENADEKALKRFRAPEGTGTEAETDVRNAGDGVPYRGDAEGKDAGGKPPAHTEGSGDAGGRNGATLSGCFFHDPTQQVMDEIFAFLKQKKLAPAVGNVYDLKQIKEAVTAQDEGGAIGKIVVTV